MNISENRALTKEEQQRFVNALSANLAPLRAKVGISQAELANLIGVSRQTYSAVECGKRAMSWSVYLTLILFFDYNKATHRMLRSVSAFPDELVERFNDGKVFLSGLSVLSDEKQAEETIDMLQRLDEQGLHAMRTVLLMEYGRCTNSV